MPSTVKRGDYWLIGCFFVLAFAVVFAANGSLVYFALRSAPGSVNDRPYDAGINYNRVLARTAVQDALGWRGRVDFMQSAADQSDGRSGRITVRLFDRDGAVLAGAELEVRVLRPVGPGEAMTLRLSERRPGEYVAPIVLSRIGQWDIRVTARRGADAFEMGQRIDVR